MLQKSWRYLLAYLILVFGLFTLKEVHIHLASNLPGPLDLLGAYARWGQSADLLRYFSYANLMAGGGAEWSQLTEWWGNTGGVKLLAPHGQGPLLPYRDFTVEYPPVNLLFIAIPRLFTAEPEVYGQIFVAEMGLLNLASLALAIAVAGGRSERLIKLTFWSTLALGPIVASRLDSVTTLFLMLALWATCRDRPGLAGLSLGLAAGAKLFPALLLPALAWHWQSSGSGGKAWRCLGAAILTLAAIFLPLLALGGESLFAFHSQRPIEVESNLGALMLLHKACGGPEVVAQAFGSRCLQAPYADTLAQVAGPLPWLLWAGLGLLYARTLRSHPEADTAQRREWLLRATGSLFVGLLLTAKVLSPQYLTWLLPTLFLLDDRFVDRLLLASCALTQAVYPLVFEGLCEGQTAAVLLLLLRNALLAAIFAVCLRPIARGREPDKSSRNAAAETNPE